VISFLKVDCTSFWSEVYLDILILPYFSYKAKLNELLVSVCVTKEFSVLCKIVVRSVENINCNVEHSFKRN
jgi:hypothetical protein